jgi:hypothetical protein
VIEVHCQGPLGYKFGEGTGSLNGTRLLLDVKRWFAYRVRGTKGSLHIVDLSNLNAMMEPTSGCLNPVDEGTVALRRSRHIEKGLW